MKVRDSNNFKKNVKPITFYPDDTIKEALHTMCEKNIGSIVVINQDNTVAGIVTERNMMIRVLNAKVNTEYTPLSQIMTKNVKLANENDDILDCMKKMSNERFRHLPIVDENNKLIGMISQGDFLAYTWPDLYEKVTKDLRSKLAKSFQALLLVFAVVTLGLIAFKL